MNCGSPTSWKRRFRRPVQLIAVTHPQGVEIYPNEGMTIHRVLSNFYNAWRAPPLSAIDDHGNDVLSRISRMDRQYPDDFHRDRIRGYADEHTLTMKLAETETADTGTAGVPPAVSWNRRTPVARCGSRKRAGRPRSQ
jgi:hypothetical protein